MNCMIFEYTNLVNLHEHLVLNSPHIWKQPTDTKFKHINIVGTSTDSLIAVAAQVTFVYEIFIYVYISLG